MTAWPAPAGVAVHFRRALGAAKARARTGVRSAKTALRITDRRRWQRLPVTMHADTRERARTLAALIPPGSAVLDLGSGPQYLRAYLPAESHYQPVDLAPGADVIVCDLNEGMPVIDRRYDVVVCAGVIEYLREPRRFLRSLPALGDTLLVTYVGRDAPEEAGKLSRRLHRIADGFMVHLTYPQFEDTLTALGFRWEVVGYWSGAGRGYRLIPRDAS